MKTDKKRIYLDAHATTSVDPFLIQKYAEHLEKIWGNPSSVHYEGRIAKALLLDAKRRIQTLLQVPKRYEIFFFSTATEALNTLLQGVVSYKKSKKKRESHSELARSLFLSTEVEHAAVYETICKMDDIEPLYAPIDIDGVLSKNRLFDLVESASVPIVAASIMAANNETGVVTSDLQDIADFLHTKSIPLIVDGVAFVGRGIDIPWSEGISAFVFSGHKLHIPKGVAVAIVDKRLRFQPLFFGGPQESTKRPGTENVPLDILVADGLELVMASHQKDREHLYELQSYFESRLEEICPSIVIHGKKAPHRLPSVSNVSFPGVSGEDLLIQLDLVGISASHGSACSSGSLEPSRVLMKMGLTYELCDSSIRFSWSRRTQKSEIDEALLRLKSLL